MADSISRFTVFTFMCVLALYTVYLAFSIWGSDAEKDQKYREEHRAIR